MKEELKDYVIFSQPERKSQTPRNGAVIYLRKPLDNGLVGNTGITRQMHCELLAQKRKLNVVERFVEQPDEKNKIGHEQFDRMVEFVKTRPDIGYVIVYGLVYFPLDAVQRMKAIEQFHNAAIEICSAQREYGLVMNSQGVKADFLFNMSLLFHETQKERSILGTRQKVRQGFHCGPIPYGYTKGKPTRKNKTGIHINKDGLLLREAFHLKALTDMPEKEICELLKSRGWDKSPKQLRQFFTNPFYAGVLVHKLLPGEPIQGLHPALVTHAVFKKVNGMTDSLIDDNKK